MTEVVTQTKADPELVELLKRHAAANDMTLRELYIQAIRAFLARRDGLVTKRRPTQYLYFASPSNGRNYNLRLPEALVNRLYITAEEDNASLRRLLYTALVQFAREKRLIDVD